jgi:hypothetical protein
MIYIHQRYSRIEPRNKPQPPPPKFSLNESKWAGHAACLGEVKKVYKTLTGKCEATRPLWRFICRQQGNIK